MSVQQSHVSNIYLEIGVTSSLLCAADATLRGTPRLLAKIYFLISHSYTRETFFIIASKCYESAFDVGRGSTLAKRQNSSERNVNASRWTPAEKQTIDLGDDTRLDRIATFDKWNLKFAIEPQRNFNN